MRVGIKAVLVACLGVWSIQASASLDVTCYDDDCLAKGWNIFDSRNGRQSSVRCEHGDCYTKGWSERARYSGESTVTECIEDDCWGVGWTTYDRFRGYVISESICFDHGGYGVAGDPGDSDGDAKKPSYNCLTYGWETRFRNGGYTQTTCQDGDCRKLGWEVYIPGLGFQTARCKSGGCFKAGWRIYP